VSEPVLLVRARRLRAARGVVVARDVALDAAPGDVVAVEGPNGSGKSTLLAAAAGLLPADNASVRPGSVGYSPERAGVLPRIPLHRWLLGLARTAGLGRDESSRRAGDLLGRLGLAHASAMSLHALSRGNAQRALVAQLEAQVQADQGAIENAKAILSYTRIVAPLAGRTGIRQVDAGNIVHAADTTGIVVITQVRPIAVIFTLPQQRLAQVNKAFAQGALSVQALGDDNRTVVDRGTLTVIDNQVDQTTGTVKLKAEFPNKDLQIWPGQFVNVKLLVETLPQVIVIPSAAVQRGPNGTFAYVANDDNTVTVHPVTVAQQDDMEAVIAEGIDDGERVVTTGFAQLTDGAKIAIGTQEDLRRPAGSERRRGAPRQTPSAQSSPRPRTETAARPADTPSAGATREPASPEQSRGTAQQTQSGGTTTTATP